MIRTRTRRPRSPKVYRIPVETYLVALAATFAGPLRRPVFSRGSATKLSCGVAISASMWRPWTSNSYPSSRGGQLRALRCATAWRGHAHPRPREGQRRSGGRPLEPRDRLDEIRKSFLRLTTRSETPGARARPPRRGDGCNRPVREHLTELLFFPSGPSCSKRKTS